MIYILDKNNNVMASCSELPDENDLASREEHIHIEDSNIPAGDALFINGKLERKQKPLENAKTRDYAKVYGRMFKHFANELEAEGEIESDDVKDYKDVVQKKKEKE